MIKEKTQYFQELVIGTTIPVSILKPSSLMSNLKNKPSKTNKNVQFVNENQEHIYDDTSSKISKNKQITKRSSLGSISINLQPNNLPNLRIKSP